MMTIQQTLSIVKPDGVRRNLMGQILMRVENVGLKIVASKMLWLSKEQATEFYAVHKERHFFADLVKFMSSGPILVQVLQGENAVTVYRDLMGATDPRDAKIGTIRRDFARSVEANVVHGSDSAENALAEIAFFFTPEEVFYRH